MTTFGSPTSPLHEDEDEEASTSTINNYMINTSRIDVTLPPSLPTPRSNLTSCCGEKKNSPPESDYLTHVAPFARQAILREGDLLFMSPGWWHALKSLETSFGVSIWF